VNYPADLTELAKPQPMGHRRGRLQAPDKEIRSRRDRRLAASQLIRQRGKTESVSEYTPKGKEVERIEDYDPHWYEKLVKSLRGYRGGRYGP
jgi:hypothetical protein